MKFSTVPTASRHPARLAKLLLKLGSVAALVSSAGCAAMNEFCDELVVHAMVRQAQQQYSVPCNLGPAEACHYKAGWRAGYYSVATGGDGCPPLVPPQKYWKLTHPSRACQVDVWYRGFAAGARAGHEQGAQDGYFVPVMHCGCGVGGASNFCAANCCVEGQLPYLPATQTPEPVEPLAAPIEATKIPDAHNFQEESLPKINLIYPNEIIPDVSEAMLWEEPLESSKSAWFGQAVPLAMELAEQLDQTLSRLDEQVASMGGSEGGSEAGSTLEFQEIELTGLIEMAEAESAIVQPLSVLPYPLWEPETLEKQITNQQSLELTNPAAQNVVGPNPDRAKR